MGLTEVGDEPSQMKIMVLDVGVAVVGIFECS